MFLTKIVDRSLEFKFHENLSTIDSNTYKVEQHEHGPNFKLNILINKNLPLSQKLRFFRGSRFSQCFKVSTVFHCLLTYKFLCQQLFLAITKRVQCL